MICTGYKNLIINNYFIKKFKTQIISKKNYLKIFVKKYGWTIELVYSGINCGTGGRLLRAKKYLINIENFCLTYGDGLSNINLKSYKFSQKKE